MILIDSDETDRLRHDSHKGLKETKTFLIDYY